MVTSECGLTSWECFFSVALTYELMCGFPMACGDSRWKKVWHLPVKERTRCFIWQLKHDHLLTNERKRKMQLGGSSCGSCVGILESTIHVLRDCPKAMEVWIHLVCLEERDNFFDIGLAQWIEANMSMSLDVDFGVDWSRVWANTCYALWLWQNRKIHVETFLRSFRPWQLMLNETREYGRISSNLCHGCIP